ncbi:hypothetical protein IJD44_10685 [bacterium]|nr:hypothetical protein [bacterium]
MKIKKNIRVAIMCSIMPIAIAFLLYKYSYKDIATYVLFSFFTIALLSIIIPPIGFYIYKQSSKIGKIIGKYVAIVALFFVYICTVLPTGILMKIVKRDRLRLKMPTVESYWQKYENKNSDYEYQF